MDTLEFLNKILPSEGFRVAFIVKPNEDDPKRPIKYNRICKSTGELATLIGRVDDAGWTVYHANATYVEWRKKDMRTHENAHQAKALWLDLDCGPAKPFATQQEAAGALRDFCAKTGMPAPTIVLSGMGMHIYWTLTHPLPRPQWEKIATMLKSVCDWAGLDADPACTTDIARVLRTPGTFHRKTDTPKPVRVVKMGEDNEPRDLAAVLMRICKDNALQVSKLNGKSKPTNSLNSALSNIYPDRDHDPDLVAEKCAHVRMFRDSKGDMEEPLWHACLGVIHHCNDGDAVCHKWSSGHDDYDKGETDDKLHNLSKIGPTTCARFKLLDKTLCAVCHMSGVITTPLQLGVTVEQIEAPQVATETGFIEAAPPRPYTRGKDGVYVTVETEDGVTFPHKFYDRDIYPCRLLYDHHHGYEQVEVTHFKPVDGWQMFKIRTASLMDQRDCAKSFADNGVYISARGDRQYMANYMVDYIKSLQEKSATINLFNNMGWKDDFTKFVIGPSIVMEDKVRDVGLSDGISRKMAAGYHVAGDVAEWSRATRLLEVDGMEGLRFALMCGFGAPLMALTGFEAVMVNMLGSSGVGKSTVQRLIGSIYGNPLTTGISFSDTQNAQFSRMAAVGHLPVTVDEITNIQPDKLSDFVYRLTQGRDKVRLRQDATERETRGEWRTIVVTSSNESMIGKLQLLKANPEAEAMRVFEYIIPYSDVFAKRHAKFINRTIVRNFGGAGRVYIQKLLQMGREELLRRIDIAMAEADDVIEFTGAERYWHCLTGMCLLGGQIAQELGLVGFKAEDVLPWVREQIHTLRSDVAGGATDPIDLLSDYIHTNIDYKLVIGSGGVVNENIVNEFIPQADMPRRELRMRIEVADGKLFIDRAHFRKHIANRGGDVKTVTNTLEASKLVVGSRRIVMGKGTPIPSAQTHCIIVDLEHPAMTDVRSVAITEIQTET